MDEKQHEQPTTGLTLDEAYAAAAEIIAPAMLRAARKQRPDLFEHHDQEHIMTNAALPQVNPASLHPTEDQVQGIIACLSEIVEWEKARGQQNRENVPADISSGDLS